MSDFGTFLGVCYADNQLFYSINSPLQSQHLQRIGSIDFNFDVADAIVKGHPKSFDAVRNALNKLRVQYECREARILLPATEECWSILPRIAHEKSDEREASLKVLMHGVERENIETTWYGLSSKDYKMLLVRNNSTMEGFRKLFNGFASVDYVAEPEIGNDWQKHTQINGSYLTLHCHHNHIVVSSYLLGKLRGATYILYEYLIDLPYLWKFHATHLSWLRGIHEQVYVYGQHAQEILEILTGSIDDFGEIILMNTLENMQVHADEETYSFRLESAFPAIMLSLNISEQQLT